MNKSERSEILRERSQLLRSIRDFFYQKDFVEVQTPTISADTMVDSSIDPISVQLAGHDNSFFLQTSPEFAMKRLLMEGLPRIFEITSAFRNAESGSRHNPEFTLLEWYRVGDSYEQGIDLLVQLGLHLFPQFPVDSRTYQEIFESLLHVNPHTATFDELLDICKVNKLELPTSLETRDQLLEIIMSELVEPGLGNQSLCVVRDWPASQCALARLRDTDDGYSVAERFEAYINGIELANGYHELTDPVEQLQRMESNNYLRRQSGLAELPVNSRLLSAMAENPLPNCCGVAAGVDRILMVKLGLPTLSETMCFDIHQA